MAPSRTLYVWFLWRRLGFPWYFSHQKGLTPWNIGRIVWVMDRGMSGDENRRMLQRVGVQYILGEIREVSPLGSREVGGILRREFGISGSRNRGIRREIISQLKRVFYAVKGCDDCLEEDDDVIVYYTDFGQYEIFHNELS